VAPRHIAVVGGGITGLAAALAICDRAGPDVGAIGVTVLEQSSNLGGKLLSGTLRWDGHTQAIELGADAFLVRTPAALELVSRLGLSDEVIHPHTGQAHIFLNGALHVLPTTTVMGVPADPASLVDAGLLPAAAGRQISAEPDLPGEPLVADVSVGELVRRRFGDVVVDNIIDPLLGGVYAGNVDALSLQATIPALAAALRSDSSLLRAAQAVRAVAKGGPTFGALRGGMRRLVDAAKQTLSAAKHRGEPVAQVRCDAPVRRLDRGEQGWELTVGSGHDRQLVSADAVLLATPAPTSARLLRQVAPEVAAELAAIDYASVAVISFAFPELVLPDGSGMLIPSSSGLIIKAATFVDHKWGQAAPDVSLVRVSLGRHGDVQALRRNDTELVATALAQLQLVLGPLPAPLASKVQRWDGAMPQYTVGHNARVAQARDLLGEDRSIALAGAGYDGVGITGCISSAQRAADALLA